MNLQPAVLETAALPIELPPYVNCMNIHDIAVQVTRREDAPHSRIDIAEATAVLFALAHLMRANGLIWTIRAALAIRRSVKKP